MGSIVGCHLPEREIARILVRRPVRPSHQNPIMTSPPEKSDRCQDQRASVALLAIMLVMAGMTAGAIEQVATRAVESVQRDCRLVDGAIRRADTPLHAVRCEDPAGNHQNESRIGRTRIGLDHLAGTAQELERRRHDLPPPTIA